MQRNTFVVKVLKVQSRWSVEDAKHDFATIIRRNPAPIGFVVNKAHFRAGFQ
jgi:hypothetical protein